MTPSEAEFSSVATTDPSGARSRSPTSAVEPGVAVRRTGYGYSLISEHTGAPIARLKPTGDADRVQVLWWNGRSWGASGPLGIATMPLDAALDYIASEATFWINT